MGWPVEWACPATAEVAVSAFRTALWCSLRRCVLPVCPMYVRGQFVQGMRYTTPGLSCWGTWSLECTRSCRKVLMGWEVVLMPRGDRTRLMASEVPLMYGIYRGWGSDIGGLLKRRGIMRGLEVARVEMAYNSFQFIFSLDAFMVLHRTVVHCAGRMMHLNNNDYMNMNTNILSHVHLHCLVQFT